jgi:HPt (histidine-containing phosphotransfer) domain-containing protein
VIYQDIPLVDSNRLSELAMMDDEGGFVRELVDLFIADSSSSMSELEHALAASDLTNVRKIAHRLKGSALSIGANRFAALASDIESDDQTDSIEASADSMITLRDETISALLQHCA